MLAIGIIGASGYTGFELVKIALKHKHISKIKLYGHSSSGQSYSKLYPELSGFNCIIEAIEYIDFTLDVYFLALPHTKSIEIVEKLVKSYKCIIDLSADFRLNSKDLYDLVYHQNHTASELLTTKVYGLSEFVSSDKFKCASVIANPGCFPTVTLLSLLPLVKNFSNKINSISTVAYSGVSGAGKTSTADLSYSEMFGNTKAYSVLTHRHQPEIEQELQNNFPYSITMHLLPVKRGIYATHTIFLNEAIEYEKLNEVYQSTYKEKAFVRMREMPPELNWVIQTNYCDINFQVKGKNIVITSCIDNLIKGASGQAIQNMNLNFGFNETEGLI
jgi:N-acetyl-gamma-glutamyl-phosphate reductase